VSTIVFFILGLILQNQLATFTGIDPKYISYAIYILALDALVIIPFAWLRAE